MCRRKCCFKSSLSCLLPADKLQTLSAGLVFSPDLQTMAYGPVDDCVKILDIRTRTVCGSLAIPEQRRSAAIGCMAFSKDGRRLAVTAGVPFLPQEVRSTSIHHEPWQAVVWELATGNQLGTIPDINSHLMAFLPDGKTLALTDYQSEGIIDISPDSPPVTTCLYDVTTGDKKQILSSRICPDPWAISGDGNVLAVAEQRCTEKPVEVCYYQIVVRNLATGDELARFPPETEYYLVSGTV